MRAPVAVFLYRRPAHTRLTLEALDRSPLAPESELFLFLDREANGGEENAVEAVRSLALSYRQKSRFRRVVLREASCHQGLARSVICGVSHLIGRYGRVIVVEDDLVTAPGFLTYMNEALDVYAAQSAVWSISGYTPCLPLPPDYLPPVYLTGRGCSWGWATWRDRWELVDWEVADYARFRWNLYRRRQFNRGGCDLADTLDAQMRGERDSWAVRWCYTQNRLRKWTIYPRRSLVRNIGLDGTGTHDADGTRFQTALSEACGCRLAPLEPDRRILKAFRRQFAPSPWIRLRRAVRSVWKRLTTRRRKPDDNR